MGAPRGERPSPHPYVLLAKRAVCLTASRLDPFLYIDRGKYCAMPEMTVRRGCFVSIKKGPLGELRGCIGTVRPVRENLWEEIVANARAAASEDPRFPPLEPGETAACLVSVDILDEPAPIEDLSDLDPSLYGVIVERGGEKRGSPARPGRRGHRGAADLHRHEESGDWARGGGRHIPV